MHARRRPPSRFFACNMVSAFCTSSSERVRRAASISRRRAHRVDRTGPRPFKRTSSTRDSAGPALYQPVLSAPRVSLAQYCPRLHATPQSSPRARNIALQLIHAFTPPTSTLPVARSSSFSVLRRRPFAPTHSFPDRRPVRPRRVRVSLRRRGPDLRSRAFAARVD